MSARRRSLRAVGLGLALAACGPADSPTAPSNPAGPDGLVQVVDLAARADGSPAAVTLDVTAQFPDVCTQLKDTTVERQRTRVEVTLTTRRTADFCILLYPAPTVIAVLLPGVFAPGDYVAVVNGRELRFTV